MQTLEKEISRLNKEQLEAVKNIDGPLLVIAGPGTGKTQLLSARVARILQKTDTLPQNILCLTFTESGAENMRERLTRFIGQSAYDVNISTYHAFGGDLVRNYPQYFSELKLLNPIDQLGRHQILDNIVSNMSYLNPLKQTRHHLGDLINTIGEVKRSLLTSQDLRTIAKENADFIVAASKSISGIFSDFTRMPSKLDKAMPIFAKTYEALTALIPAQPAVPKFGSLAAVAAEELKSAIEEAEVLGKSTPLTKWKNKWLAKDSNNNFIFDGELENKRIDALADVFDSYQAALHEKGLYDFDDMIIRALEALKNNDDFRYTLQEKYLYILLDEFQDTNAAQLELVHQLSDNPVNEGRPNVMAVGDDDQAIYAFQGAQYSNMLDFYHMFRNVKVINLNRNYRSHADVLLTAHNIAEQIDARLHHQFDDMTKTLVASNDGLPQKSLITRNEFQSDIAQYDWIAERIEALIKQGTSPSEIAVLAPKHKQIEPLVPYLNSREIPVRYEKRENILETNVIKQLLSMCRLVQALHTEDVNTANALWPEVLSYDFWSIPTSTIWQISWQINDAREEQVNWSRALLQNDKCKPAALLILSLASIASLETCETMLDYIIGSEEVATHEEDIPFVRSPLRSFYTSKSTQLSNPQIFYETLSHLKVLRSKLRAHQATAESALNLSDLIAFIDMYKSAEERMINTSPYNQQADSVQLMTVFKAKGLEFEHVFLPCCQDEVWGSSSRGNSNKLTLPANLSPIRHAGSTDDERLRILYVALTRAKIGLYLTNYSQSYSGKSTKRLKFLNEQEHEDGNMRCMTLPTPVQTVLFNDHTAPLIEQLEMDWRIRHHDYVSASDLQGLLLERVKHYKLSPTHLNSFLDTQYAGPEKFFMNTLLRFPQAPSVDGQYGNAIHETLEWCQYYVDEHGEIPEIQKTNAYFSARILNKKLSPDQTQLEIERGKRALASYLTSRSHIFKPGDKAEHNFSNEGVFVGDVRMSGKIDRMEIDKHKKTVTVVDYKTGKSFSSWRSETKLHKYRQQLYCYKLLIENSRTYRGYTVDIGRIEFIEPDSNNQINTLELTFKDDELKSTKDLLTIMWDHVMRLDFPSIEKYADTLKGMKEFESDLLEGKI